MLTKAFCVLGLLSISFGCRPRTERAEIGQPSVKLPESREDRPAWYKVLRWSDDCETAYKATGQGHGLQFYKLQEKVSLVEVACASGAYQGSQEYFLLDLRASAPDVQALSFRTYE